MADFRIADINIGSALVENWGRATAYFQRYLQATNAQISAAIVGLQAVITELADQQVQILEAIALAEEAIEASEETLITLTDFLLSMGLGSYGLATVTPNGSGDVTIPHSYVTGDYPPALGACTMTPTGTTFFHPQMTSVDGSNLYARLFDAAGVPITSGSYVVAFRVAGV